MDRRLAFLVYWLIMLIVWWFLVGNNINKMYKQTLGQASLQSDRRILIIITVCDLILAPFYMPIEILRRLLNRASNMP
jgi:hypothetical protein